MCDNISYSSHATVTKYHKPDDLTEIYLSVLEAGKLKVKVQADSVPGENSLPGL